MIRLNSERGPVHLESREGVIGLPRFTVALLGVSEVDLGKILRPSAEISCGNRGLLERHCSDQTEWNLEMRRVDLQNLDDERLVELDLSGDRGNQLA